MADSCKVLQSWLLITPRSHVLPPKRSDMGLHALLEGPGEVRVLRGGLGIVGGRRGRCLAVFVELHVAVRLTVAADAAVALRVNKRAGVAERAALELPLAQLDGTAAHAQHKALAVVIQTVGACSQRRVDVGERHACWYPLFAQSTRVGGVPHFSGLIPCHGWSVGLFESIDTVIAISRVLLKKHKRERKILVIIIMNNVFFKYNVKEKKIMCIGCI